MTDRVDCLADVCLTCSDEALPALVIRLMDHQLAVAEIGGVHEQVSVALVDAVAGDTVLVHAKEAIAVISRGSGGHG
ncbi:HypC/HybG/HupF family hydrogenase formation chaperone [Sphaerisporangium corydalis]|uniref:HypC/HybG/HupF family hydrogenase formation chaperone n=1 Tax=Sphaerisporangium corydalis TaxID=1441875 RepID=A0ABV9EA00_9ACTN|nr:HypC/HybG/HupF family hydrogenase formation chaperone [Sphaerisporangium corydalis]